jgi:hypothetical protein
MKEIRTFEAAIEQSATSLKNSALTQPYSGHTEPARKPETSLSTSTRSFGITTLKKLLRP